MATDFMSNRANHNSATVDAAMPAAGDMPATTEDRIRHLYVHIPFCARICPYCAFYKARANHSETQRFCEAPVRELSQKSTEFDLAPETIFFGGGTATALTTAQFEFLLRGFPEQLDLSGLVEWTMEANPGSVAARKADVLKRFGVNRLSLGVQSW